MKNIPALNNELAQLADPALSPERTHLFVEYFRQLRAFFPDESNAYIAKWQRTPWETFSADYREAAVSTDHFPNVIADATEYLPLTDFQWAALSAPERAKWQRTKKILDALKVGSVDVSDFLFLETLSNDRPRVQERVAPRVAPHTPPILPPDPARTRALLEQDWLFQANGKPTAARALAEIAYARALATRFQKAEPLSPKQVLCSPFTGRERPTPPPPLAATATASPAPSPPTLPTRLAPLLAQLLPLENRLLALPPNAATPVAKALYLDVRRVKRAITLLNPLLDFDTLLYIDNPYPAGSEWDHETRHELGYMAVPGGRLLLQKGFDPGAPLTQIAPTAPLHGTFWRPDLSHDATKILYSFKPHNEKTFHIYEIGVDGTGLRQLTSGMFDDFDPIYLPDQKNILFTTTRGHNYVRCMPPTNSPVLARLPLDTKPGDKTLYIISRNGEPEYTPSVMRDGRVLYTRWEYTDKSVFRGQSLWTMNPNGTNVQTLWGNQTVWPDLPKDARQIPGSDRILFTGSAHHNWFSGCIGIIDPTKGLNFPHGLTKVTQELPWPESGNGPTDPKESPTYHTAGKYTAYYSPFPLGEKDFLVSAKRGGRDSKFVLLLMDTDGNRELLAEGTHNIWEAQPLRPRPAPRATPDTVQWPTWADRATPAPGQLYTSDVFENAPPGLKERAKFLRIWTIDPKTYTYWHRRDYISSGPAISAVQSEGVKRILGTVPIEPDGSINFTAPSGIPLHFQLLDADHHALHTMKSFTGVLPGEQRGCVGCHEKQMNTPNTNFTAKAFKRPPSPITPVPWKDVTISYERYVQPALDKHCASCHAEPLNPRALAAFNSRLRPGFLGFKEPYMTFLGWPTWGSRHRKIAPTSGAFGWADTFLVDSFDQRDPAAYATYKPMTLLSYKSRLVKRMSGQKVSPTDAHAPIHVDPENLLRVKLWVDAMAPYFGAEELQRFADPDFQGRAWLSQRPRIQTAPRIRRPGPFDPFHTDTDPAYFPPAPAQ